jgi:hypothetical protein
MGTGGSPDVYLQNQVRLVIAMDAMARGRMNDARESAHQLLEFGRRLNDPRSTGLGLWLLAYIALFSDSYAEALDYSEQALAVVVTPIDRTIALGGKATALIALGRVEEGVRDLEEYRRRCEALGYLLALDTSDVWLGICKILQGQIGKGIEVVDEAILKCEREGLSFFANLARLNLAEVYLRVLAGTEKPAISVLLKNLPTILKVMLLGSKRVQVLVARALENPQLDPAAHLVGRAHMILGMLYKVKKKRGLAVQQLTKARRILSQFGQTPLLGRVETALAELTQ